MLSNSKDYFTLMVEPTVTEFINSPHELRRGLLAAIVLNHMVDHFAQENELAADRNTMNNRVNAQRGEMLKICPEFQLIRNIADATKHAKLSIKNPREVSSPSQFSSSLGLFDAPFGEGVFAEAVEIFVIVENGLEKPLLPVVKIVFETLRSKILEQASVVSMQ